MPEREVSPGDSPLETLPPHFLPIPDSRAVHPDDPLPFSPGPHEPPMTELVPPPYSLFPLLFFFFSEMVRQSVLPFEELFPGTYPFF